MYARTVQDRTLTLVNAGMLWTRSGRPAGSDADTVVLNDLETMSEWPHALGEAVRGPLRGAKLATVPSVMVTWREWKTNHPDTTVSVLPRTTHEYTAQVYDQPARYVAGLWLGGEAVAYPLPRLMSETLIQDTLAGEPVLVLYLPSGHGAAAFRRKLDGQTLQFTLREGQLLAGGSHWNPLTGQALDGPWKGNRLEPLDVLISLAETWRRYRPQARVFGQEAPKR